MNEGISLIPECNNCIHRAVCSRMDLYKKLIRDLEGTIRKSAQDYDGLSMMLSDSVILHICELYNWA